MKRKAPKKTKTKVTHHVCSYHQKHPKDKSYPACMCFITYTIPVR